MAVSKVAPIPLHRALFEISHLYWCPKPTGHLRALI